MPPEGNEHFPIAPDHRLPAPQPEKKRSTAVRVLVWIVLLAVFAAGFWFVLNRKPDTKVAAAPRRGPGGGR